MKLFGRRIMAVSTEKIGPAQLSATGGLDLKQRIFVWHVALARA